MPTNELFPVTNHAQPVLRWAGSKRRITPILSAYAPPKYERYFEPFVGSGALFFCLRPPLAFIGDVNPEVTSTYQALKDAPSQVAQHLTEIPKTKDAYLLLRQLRPADLTTAQRAARLIFLMKSCFNGVYRTNASGQFNVPFGSTIYKLPTSEELQSVSDALKLTQVRTGDYKSWLDIAGVGDFIYLDPPYSCSSRYRGEYGYDAIFGDVQLEELLTCCKALQNRGAKVMLSYKNNKQVVNALKDWRILNLAVPRSVNANSMGRTPAAEILAMNY
ncbi:DNA adenine methylase [Polaromonas sp. JS666]|nr:DNA adenine methylase [Polaromonas sp. JS666]